MTQKQMDMTNKIVSQLIESNAEVRIDLQIRKLDGVDVGVDLHFDMANTFLERAFLKIHSTDVYEVVDDCDIQEKRLFTKVFKFTKDSTQLYAQVASILLECKTILTTIKFSKLLGVFTTQAPTPSFCEAFDISNETGVISIFEECCVCYEKTITLTSCNHALCIPCWSKTRYTRDEEGDQVKLCPTCRANIH